MGKTIVTTSHRPTPRTRSLLKDLVAIIPNSIRITRGKATLELLALEALDIGADRILIIRNWKGNPRYIDLYMVTPLSRGATKICTLILCGYKLTREGTKKNPAKQPSALVIPVSTVVSAKIPEELMECLVQCLRAQVSSDEEVCGKDRNVLIVDVSESHDNVFEISFRDCKGDQYGPVLRVCGAKIIGTGQG